MGSSSTRDGRLPWTAPVTKSLPRSRNAFWKADLSRLKTRTVGCHVLVLKSSGNGLPARNRVCSLRGAGLEDWVERWLSPPLSCPTYSAGGIADGCDPPSVIRKTPRPIHPVEKTESHGQLVRSWSWSLRQASRHIPRTRCTQNPSSLIPASRE